MNKDLKLLAPPEKKVAAKVLYDMGWSTRKIEGWLGVDYSIVSRYVKTPTPDELQQFATDFTIAIQSEKKRGIALGIKRLNELIPKERRIDPLVKGLEYLEGKQSGINVQTNVMVMPSELIEKYDIAQNTKSGSEERP